MTWMREIRGVERDTAPYDGREGLVIFKLP